MGWFDEQIKNRIRYDEEGFRSAFADLSSVVMGKSALSDTGNSDRLKTKDAIDEILKYYHMTPATLPDDINDLHDQLEYLLRPTGIMRRVVKLSGKWWRNAVGPLLGQKENGSVVALIPAGLSGYAYFDYDSQSAQSRGLLLLQAVPASKAGP